MVKTWLAPKKEKKQIQIVTPGQHLAIIIGLVDLGLHDSTYQGVTRTVPKVMVTFEIVDEFMQSGEHEGKPLVLSKEYTFSFDKKANFKKELIDKVFGKIHTDEEMNEFPAHTLLGKGCDLTVINKVNEKDGLTYANVAGVSPLRKTDKLPQPVGELLLYRTDDHDEVTFQKITKWVREKIHRESTDYSVVNEASKF